MAKPSDVSQEDVFHACYQLLAGGKNPSFPSVYELLGNKGSAKIVQEHITAWRQFVAASHFNQRSRPGIPDLVVARADQLTDSIWVEAIALVEGQLEARRQEVEAEIAQVRLDSAEAVAQATEAAASATRKADVLDARISGLLAEGQALAARNTDLNHMLVARDETIASQLGTLAAKDRERHALQADVKVLEGEKRALLADLDASRREARALAEANSAVKAEYGIMRERAEALEKELTVARERNARQGAELREVASRCAAAEKALAASAAATRALHGGAVSLGRRGIPKPVFKLKK